MKNNLLKFVSVFSLLASAPLVAFAQSDAQCLSVTGLGFIICKIDQLLGYVLPVLVALGVVYFVWGVVQYMIGDSEEAKKKGRDGIIFGVIGLTVIIGLWGLVTILTNTFIKPGTMGAPDKSDLQGLLP